LPEHFTAGLTEWLIVISLMGIDSRVKA